MPICFWVVCFRSNCEYSSFLSADTPSPKIFGVNEDQPLDVDAARKAFEKLAETINAEKAGDKLSIEEIASGFLEVANEAMCRPIRT